jgi:TonB family protein
MGTRSTGGPSRPAWDSAIDRREAPRQNVVDSHLVTVDLAFQSGALLLDLSEAGMGVQALSSAPPGDTTSLHFDLPETGGQIDGLGRIAWTDSSGRLGIRFEEISELSRTHLMQWLSRERRPLVSLAANLAMPAWPPAHMRDEIAALRRDLVTQKLEGDPALALVVERTRSVTRATGAAVALEDRGSVICRASSGNAPAIGAHLDPNSGLSGECVRSGEIVRCEDTETDPRADRLVCRKLDLRSIVIVPIRIQGRPSGVLEVFSSRPHAFQSNDVLLLRRVADLVAGIAIRQLDSSHQAPAGPHAVMAATVLEPLEPLEPEPAATEPSPLMMDHFFELNALADIVPSLQEEPPLPATVKAPEEPPQVAVEPSSSATPILAEEKVEREIPAGPPPETKAEVEREPAAIAVAPEAAAAALQPPKVTAPPEAERRMAPAATQSKTTPTTERRFPAASVPMVGSGTAAAAAAAKAVSKPKPVTAEELEIDSARRLEPLLAEMAERPSQWRMRLTGGAILVAVLVVGGWQVWRMVAPSRGTPMDSEIKSLQPAPPPPPQTATTLPAPASTTPTPAAPRKTPASVRPAAAKLVPVSPTPPPPRIPAGEPAATTPDDVTKRIADGTAAPATASVGPQTPAAQITLPPPAKAADVPPPIGFVSRPVNSSAISTALSTPVAAPSLAPPPVSRITGGKLLRRVNPVYPSSAMGVYGEVMLKATIGKDGKVKSVKVVKGQAALAQSAVAAIRRWRYQPFILNGMPVEVENTILVEFKSPDHR